MTKSAAIGSSSGFRFIDAHDHFLAAWFCICLVAIFFSSCNCSHDIVLRKVAVLQLAHLLAVPQNAEFVHCSEHFFNLRTDENNRHAFACKLYHKFLNFGFCSNVNATRRFVKNEKVRVGDEPASDDDLLLISAGELLDCGFWRWCLYAEHLNIFVCKLVLFCQWQ